MRIEIVPGLVMCPLGGSMLPSGTSFTTGAQRASPSARAIDGIVEESFPIEAITDPHVWYDCDDDAEYQRRLKRMVDSVTMLVTISTAETTNMILRLPTKSILVFRFRSLMSAPQIASCFTRFWPP